MEPSFITILHEFSSSQWIVFCLLFLLPGLNPPSPKEKKKTWSHLCFRLHLRETQVKIPVQQLLLKNIFLLLNFLFTSNQVLHLYLSPLPSPHLPLSLSFPLPLPLSLILSFLPSFFKSNLQQRSYIGMYLFIVVFTTAITPTAVSFYPQTWTLFRLP